MRYLLPLLPLLSACEVEVTESGADAIVAAFSLGASFARTGVATLPPAACIPLSAGASALDALADLAAANVDSLTGSASLPLVVPGISLDLSACALDIEPNPEIGAIVPVVGEIMAATAGLAIAIMDAAGLPEKDCIAYQWAVEGLGVAQVVVSQSLDAVAAGVVQVETPAFTIDASACNQ